MRPFLLTALLLATPAPAQDFSDRYAVTGTATVTAAGTDHTLYALEDLEGGRDFITITDMSPIMVYSITAAAPGPEGKPTRPYLTVTIGPFMNQPGTTADVEWRENGTAWFANSDSGTTGTLSDFSLSATGEISFTFDAPELIALETDANYNYIPVPDTAPIAVSGRFTGQLPQQN